MRFIHTSDWHLGQSLHNFDRSYEHQAFLDWLIACLVDKQADALLISGDIFDTANPSAQAQKQFYRFLQRAKQQLPHLNIVIIAGNHDSPGRLEAPAPLLETMDVAVIGFVPRLADGSIALDRLVLPLKNAAGVTTAWCLAIPLHLMLEQLQAQVQQCRQSTQTAQQELSSTNTLAASLQTQLQQAQQDQAQQQTLYQQTQNAWQAHPLAQEIANLALAGQALGAWIAEQTRQGQQALADIAALENSNRHLLQSKDSAQAEHEQATRSHNANKEAQQEASNAVERSKAAQLHAQEQGAQSETRQCNVVLKIATKGELEFLRCPLIPIALTM